MRVRTESLSSLERRAIGGLAGIYALRMLGLFLILPVFVLYAGVLKGQTPFLIGLALGAYGLTQAIFQIPLGMLSDRLGRKPVIAAGLLIFCAGSVLAALADTIAGVIAGRSLQGAGAIAAAVMAMAADLTRDEQRTKAMMLIGITIGAAFIASLLLGPVLNDVIGVPGIFWLTAALALIGIGVLYVWVPTPVHSTRHVDAQAAPTQFIDVLMDSRLIRLDVGIFILHCVLTALFVVVPIALVDNAGLPSNQHWRVYLPVMLLSVVVVFPAITLGERKRWMHQFFAGAVLILVVSESVLLQGHQSFLQIAAGLFLFFVAFNFLEAALPSLISKTAPGNLRGTAIGVYSTFEFLGAFVGGAAAGWLHGRYGMSAVFEFCAALLLLWFAIALTMPKPQYVTTRLINVGRRQPHEARILAQRLSRVAGVTEAVVIAEEGVAYLKVDGRTLDEAALDQITSLSVPVDGS
ncbi:MAG: MFS transporter [Acidiferrobacterales bacterium]